MRNEDAAKSLAPEPHRAENHKQIRPGVFKDSSIDPLPGVTIHRVSYLASCPMSSPAPMMRSLCGLPSVSYESRATDDLDSTSSQQPSNNAGTQPSNATNSGAPVNADVVEGEGPSQTSQPNH
ncbi:hypothetical protein FRC09_003438 [Ceratobasidium sp. 395]|nr:hypothetical protein FRC09_003438 [Ceratobasidium sp. 395]